MRRINLAFVLGLIGLFLFLMGIGFLSFGTKSLISMWAWENLTLKNGSEAMSRWMRPAQPISMKVYIFNLTNPEAVSEGAPPIFSEVGPYVYECVFLLLRKNFDEVSRPPLHWILFFCMTEGQPVDIRWIGVWCMARGQHQEKVNITQTSNFTLSYQLRNIIQFKPNLSGHLKESDMVTVINVPLVGAILSTYEAVPEFVGYWDELWRFFHPGQRNVFITTSVKDILFDGIVIDCTSKITEIYIACRGLDSRKGTSIRKEGKNFRFSFFYYKNGTSKETYQVNQGVVDLKKAAQYVSVDYSTSINTWEDADCDRINGSDGAQFPVMLNKDEKLYIFEKDICRSVYIEFEAAVNRKGVELYKQQMTLADVVKDEEDKGMEVVGRKPDICFKDGILPLMPCFGSPIVLSFPHFYLGDESYSNYTNFTPVKDLHETVAYIEPFSGITVMGLKRLQFNLEVKRIADVQITSNLVDCLFPILWVEEGMELSTELFKLLRMSLIQKKVLEYGTLILIGIGLFLIIISYGVQYITDKSCGSENDGLKKLGG